MVRIAGDVVAETKAGMKPAQGVQPPQSLLALFGWLTGLNPRGSAEGDSSHPCSSSANWVEAAVPDQPTVESVYKAYFQAASGFRQGPAEQNRRGLLSSGVVDPDPWMEILGINRPSQDVRARDSLRAALVRQSLERSEGPFTPGALQSALDASLENDDASSLSSPSSPASPADDMLRQHQFHAFLLREMLRGQDMLAEIRSILQMSVLR